MTTTEFDIQSAAKAVNQLTNNLKIASLGFRAMHVKKLPSDPQFKGVLQLASTSSLIMKAKVIPVTQSVLEKVKELFENYSLQGGEFHQCIEDISRISAPLPKEVEFVGQMQRALFAQVEMMDADIQSILERYEEEGNKVEEKMKEQGCETIRSLSAFLQFLPEVGPLVGPIVDESSTSKEHNIEFTDGQLDFAIISSLRDTVVRRFKETNEAFRSLVDLMHQVAQAVAHLKNTDDVAVTEEHVKKVSQDAKTLVNEINNFILAVPTVTSNVDAIDNHFTWDIIDDANQWMEYNPIRMNFVNVGRKLFTDSKTCLTVMSEIEQR